MELFEASTTQYRLSVPLTQYRVVKFGGTERPNPLARVHLKQMIEECEDLYPGIHIWFKRKVAPDLETGARSAILLYQGEEPVASAVIRNNDHAKLCSLRIKPGHQHSMLGHYLLDLVALGLRHKPGQKSFTETIHFTLPESMWVEYGSFFEKYGFTCKGEATAQYRLFDRELACSAKFSEVIRHALLDLPEVLPFIQSDSRESAPEILMSVMPTYLDRILSGKKTVEIRTEFSTRWKGVRVVFYASSPRQELAGEGTIEDITIDTPSSIWERYGDNIGCTRDEYFAYCGPHLKVSALKFRDIQSYRNPVTRIQLETLMSEDLRPPVSFSRVLNMKGWMTAMALSKVLRSSV